MADKVIVAAKIQVDSKQATTDVQQFNTATDKAQKSLDGVAASAAKTGKGVGEAGGSFSKLKGSIGTLSPALGQASGGVAGLSTAFKALLANPVILVISIIVGLIVTLAQKFSKMEGVSDGLGKAFGKLGGLISTFATKVLTPLIDGFVKLVEVASDAITFIADIFSPGIADAADRIGELTAALDDLNDAEAESAIARAESNRKLQEAKELAEDANVPIKDRIAALKEAGRIEKEEYDKSIALATRRAQLMLEQIAIELGGRANLIAAIRQGSLEALKAARAEILTLKNVDKEKIKAIDALIIQAEDEGAQRSKVAKKVAANLEGIAKEEAAKQKAIADKAAADQKAANEAYKKHLEEKRRIAKEQQKLTDDFNKAVKAGLTQEAEELQKLFEAGVKEDERIQKAEEERIFNNEKTRLENKKKVAELRALDDPDSPQARIALVQANLELELQALEQGDLQRQVLAKKASGEIVKIKQDEVAAKAALAEAERQNEEAKVSAIATGLGTLADLAGKQTAVGKAFAIVQTTIDTYQSAIAAYKSLAGIPVVGPALGAIAAAGAIKAGIDAVKKITAVKVPGSSAGGSAPSISAPDTSAPLAPQQQSTRIDADSIGRIGNATAPVRAFVLESDGANSQERISRLNRAARLGG